MPKSRPKSRAKFVSAASSEDAAAKLRSRNGRAGVSDGSKPTGAEVSRSDSVPRSAGAEIRRLTAELAKARDRIRELESLADTDALLGVLNRRGFERELDRAIDYIRRYRGAGAVIVLDVDRLKGVNDAHGHAAGDALLKAIAGVLSRQVRASDVVGRLGGDEFAVVLWNLSEKDALAKAASLEVGIDELVTVFRGHSIAAGASAGVAIIGEDEDAASVLERADKAMYARKQQRRRHRARFKPRLKPRSRSQAMMSGVI